MSADQTPTNGLPRVSANAWQGSELEVDSALAKIGPCPRAIYHGGELSAGHFLFHDVLGRAFRQHAFFDKIHDCGESFDGARIVHANVLNVIAAFSFLERINLRRSLETGR